MSISEEQRSLAAQQITEQRVLVDFDVAEYTLELIALKYSKGEIVIPEYQREFVWNAAHQSKLVESMLMGLPIPFLFVADIDGNLEIVDGTQRIRTICSFLDNGFALKDLEVLHKINGFTFLDLPAAEQKRFKNRTLRIIILSAKADLTTRLEVFQRINSTPQTLTDAEFRKGSFSGPFYDMIVRLSNDPQFTSLCPMSKKKRERGEGEELVLRFFAYTDRYEMFSHDVARFLNSYLADNRDLTPNLIQACEARFEKVMSFASQYMSEAFTADKKAVTPRVRFEALAVGIQLALLQQPALVPVDLGWIEGPKFKEFTRTDGSNSGPRLRARVEYVRNQLLGGDGEQ